MVGTHHAPHDDGHGLARVLRASAPSDGNVEDDSVAGILLGSGRFPVADEGCRRIGNPVLSSSTITFMELSPSGIAQ